MRKRIGKLTVAVAILATALSPQVFASDANSSVPSLPSAGGSAGSSVGEDLSVKVLDEDFESYGDVSVIYGPDNQGNLGEWVLSTSTSNTKTSVISLVEANGGKALELKKNLNSATAGDEQVSAFLSFPEALKGKFTVSLDICGVDGQGRGGAYIGTAMGKFSGRFYYWDSGAVAASVPSHVIVYNGSAKNEIKTGIKADKKWHNVRFEVDTNSKIYDVYYDEVILANDMALDALDDNGAVAGIGLEVQKDTKSLGTMQFDNIEVYDTTLQSVKDELDALTFGGTEVSENLSLPTTAAGLDINWTSSKPSILDSTGKITRTVSDEGPIAVDLMATVTHGDKSYSKTYTVTVLDIGQQIIDKLKEEIKSLNIPTEVKENIVLPTETKDGYPIAWTSKNPEYINNAGEIVLSPLVDGAVKATLTAGVDYSGINDITCDYVISIPSDYYTDEMRTNAKIAKDMEDIELDDTYTSDIDLPTKGKYGTEFIWFSGNKSVVSNSGELAGSRDSDKTVEFTVVGKLNGYQVEKKYSVIIVKSKTNKPSGSRVGSGGSVSYGSTYVPTTNSNTATDADTQKTGKFVDLQGFEWAKDDIDFLVNKGVLNGVDENRFAPSNNITREQFAAMLVRAFGFTLKEGTEPKTFADVDVSSYYAESIAILSSMGIVNGQSDTTFGVGQNITREDMAVMCSLAMGLNDANTTTSFVDSNDISDYAINSVANMKNAGIISGNDQGRFNPKDYATRAESAKIIANMVK